MFGCSLREKRLKIENINDTNVVVVILIMTKGSSDFFFFFFEIYIHYTAYYIENEYIKRIRILTGFEPKDDGRIDTTISVYYMWWFWVGYNKL